MSATGTAPDGKRPDRVYLAFLEIQAVQAAIAICLPIRANRPDGWNHIHERGTYRAFTFCSLPGGRCAGWVRIEVVRHACA